MRHFLCSLLVGFLPFGVFAQSVTGPDSPAKDYVREIVTNLVAPAVDLRPDVERTRLEATEIRIIRGGPFPGPRAGVSNGQRLILIPELFVLQLEAHIQAEVFAAQSGQPDFAEWWLDYALWRSPVLGNVSSGPFYSGSAPKLPLDYAGMRPAQIQSFLSQFEVPILGGFNSAMIDILLHELGHHALDQWYEVGVTPSSEAKKIEAAADEWASSAFKDLAEKYPNAGFLDQRNVLGRLFAIAFVFGLDRWQATAKVEPGPTHPDHVTRIASSLSSLSCDSLADAVSELCGLIESRMTVIADQTSLEKHYRERSKAGEAFAQYRLGMIEASQGDNEEACKLFLEAVGRTSQRAAHYAGWCLEFGHAGAGMNRETALRLAGRFYRAAAEVGWADSIAALARLGVDLK